MIKKIMMIVIASIGLMAGGDIAQINTPDVVDTGVYIGGGIAFDEFYGDGERNWFEDGKYNQENVGIQGNIGYIVFGEGAWDLAVEGRVGYVSLEDADYMWYGAYLKPEYDFGKVKLYGLLGYGTSDLSTDFIGSTSTVSVNSSIDEFTYGAGVEYKYASNVGVFIDYNVLPEFRNDDVNNDVITLGINYYFKG